MSLSFAKQIHRHAAGLVLLPLAAALLVGLPAGAQGTGSAQQPGQQALNPDQKPDQKQDPKQDQNQALKDAAHKARQHAQKERSLERDDILKKRAVIEQQREAQEKLCYQKFAVEGCLADARKAAREKDAPLRARELQINEAERKERAELKLQEIEEKKADNAAIPMKAQQRQAQGKTAPQPSGSGAKPAVDESAVQAQREAQAQQRAQKQADYVRRHEQNRAQADKGRAEREAKAKADYEAKLKAAADHKARALEKAGQRTPSPALPAPELAPAN